MLKRERAVDGFPVNSTSLTSRSFSSTSNIVRNPSTSCDLSCMFAVDSLALPRQISSASVLEVSNAWDASYFERAARNAASCFWKVDRVFVYADCAFASRWGIPYQQIGKLGRREEKYLDCCLLDLLQFSELFEGEAQGLLLDLGFSLDNFGELLVALRCKHVIRHIARVA